MTIFSHFGVKTKIELALLVIALVLLAMVLAMFFITTVIKETTIVGGCKKIPYGPGQSGKCGEDYYVVSILDNSEILRNPDSAPTAGYMICCRAER